MQLKYRKPLYSLEIVLIQWLVDVLNKRVVRATDELLKLEGTNNVTTTTK